MLRVIVSLSALFIAKSAFAHPGHSDLISHESIYGAILVFTLLAGSVTARAIYMRRRANNNKITANAARTN